MYFNVLFYWCQKRHQIRSFFHFSFRDLVNSLWPKSPQKARKWRLMYWFDAFLGTRESIFTSGKLAKIDAR